MYSSRRWYAAYEDAKEKPNKKPTILFESEKNSEEDKVVAYPPRNAPTGFFGGGTVPTLGTDASRTGWVEDKRRLWVTRVVYRVWVRDRANTEDIVLAVFVVLGGSLRPLRSDPTRPKEEGIGLARGFSG